MGIERVILSEKPEDLQKAVEWGRQQQQKILNEKSEYLADALMEKMTPIIMQNDNTAQEDR